MAKTYDGCSDVGYGITLNCNSWLVAGRRSLVNGNGRCRYMFFGVSGRWREWGWANLI